MTLPDKARVLQAVRDELQKRVAQAAEQARAAREGATHEEARPENDKDTRALEQSYLARGQAARVEDLVADAEALRTLHLRSFGPDDPIQAGALVAIEAQGRVRVLLLLPYAGGTKVVVDGTEVQVVTPRAALGAALLGKQPDDELSLMVQGQRREYTVVALC